MTRSLRLALTSVAVSTAILVPLRGWAQDEEADNSGVPAVEEPAAAPSPAPEEKKPVKLQPGVIASSGTFSGHAQVNTTDNISGITPSENPIYGKITRKGEQCTATVTNNSKTDTYSVSFEVQSVGEGNLRRSFSATISPEGQVQRSITCSKAQNLQVVLKSGRKL